MPIIQIIAILAVLGVVIWGVTQLPIDPTIQRLIRVVAIVAVCLWLLTLFFGVNLAGVRWR